MDPKQQISEGSTAASTRQLPRKLDTSKISLSPPTSLLDHSSGEVMVTRGTNPETIVTPDSNSSPGTTWKESDHDVSSIWLCSPQEALVNSCGESEPSRCLFSRSEHDILNDSPDHDDPRDENDSSEINGKNTREALCNIQPTYTKETYRNGLLPCFVSLISDQRGNSGSSSDEPSREEEVRWSGHLPLSEMPDHSSNQTPPWLIQRRNLLSRPPLLDNDNHQSCPLVQSTFPATLTGPDVEIFFYSVCQSEPSFHCCSLCFFLWEVFPQD
mmetsp:Transcript_4909/g.7236  ORF Transcript_4909/g.7236 Transcript_4909/m.7236 type:complete len:271 (+) Transcript_4909:155-967(+)